MTVDGDILILFHFTQKNCGLIKVDTIVWKSSPLSSKCMTVIKDKKKKFSKKCLFNTKLHLVHLRFHLRSGVWVGGVVVGCWIAVRWPHQHPAGDLITAGCSRLLFLLTLPPLHRFSGNSCKRRRLRNSEGKSSGARHSKWCHFID